MPGFVDESRRHVLGIASVAFSRLAGSPATRGAFVFAPYEFGYSYTSPAGVSGTVGKPGPAHVVLTWATFTEAADESGMSRRYAGLHFEDADLEGRASGRRVAALSWNKAQEYVSGSQRRNENRST